MIQELVKATLFAYAVVGLATIMAGGATRRIVKQKIEGTMAKKTFEEKVLDMRRFQKAYLRSRCPMTHASAKRAEAEVDDALCALFPSQTKPEPKEQLPSLFDQRQQNGR